MSFHIKIKDIQEKSVIDFVSPTKPQIFSFRNLQIKQNRKTHKNIRGTLKNIVFRCYEYYYEQIILFMSLLTAKITPIARHKELFYKNLFY